MAEFGDSRLENVVEYQIFDISFLGGESTETFDVQGVLYDILSYSQSLIGSDYIWQNDCFNLQACEGQGGHAEQIPFLEGSVNFDDNIEDEWFIVYLLMSITKRFPHAAVTVKDNDGEFLLIEAADFLPKWLEPETSENRVFLYQGKLHIVPLPTKPSEITIFPAGTPTINQSLKILKENSKITVASQWIQDPILRIIQECPNKASFHHVLCHLPMAVKYLLEKKPSLIAPAVLAFVNRDPIDEKTCQQLKHFSLESPVPHRVCFTKCLYGQLVKQNFVPDKSALKLLPEISSNAYKGHVVGLQLTYGFEILYSQQCGSRNGIPTSTTPGDQKWEKYLCALNRHGYFKEEVVGSQLYGQLIDSAQEYFLRNCLSPEGNPSKVNEIEKLLQGMPSCYECSTIEASEIPPDDDESWLEISPEELEMMLLQYGGKGQLSHGNVDLNNVVDGMNSFVETISGYEGAEFPSELSEDTDIQFDAEGFIKSLDKLFVKPGHTGRHIGESSEEESSDSTEEDEQYCQYTNAMDEELSSTHIGKSFVKIESKNVDGGSKATSSESTDIEDVMKPIDVDLNLVQNFLESYSSQDGMPGPVSNIFNSMGISVPSNNSSETNEQK